MRNHRWGLVVAGLALAVGCSPEVEEAVLPSGAAPSSPALPSSTQPTVITASPPRGGGVQLVAVELRSEDPAPGGQLVVLVNTGKQPVDVDCWHVRSADTTLDATVRAERPLSPGAQLRLLTEGNVFDSSDTVSLHDRQGRPVDRTPRLVDSAGDDQFWYRAPWGAWTFGRGFRLLAQVADGRLVVGAGSC